MTKASKKRPTILDVAKASGFKPATVSLALRGDSRIRESTRKHIERIAREQRYVPNTAGRSLCGAKPKVFGLLLTSMDRDGTRDGFELTVTKAITDAVDIPVIASGGVGNLQHLAEGVTLGGADAVLAASIFHFGEYYDY